MRPERGLPGGLLYCNLAQQFCRITEARSISAAEPLPILAQYSIAWLSQTDARASTVLVDELHAGEKFTDARSIPQFREGAQPQVSVRRNWQAARFAFVCR